MISNLEHRGPDGKGTYIDQHNNFALGHNRLSIFDVSEQGKQPMQFMDRYSITFNRAIYNFVELRNFLIAKGHHFKSQSDTEVILPPMQNGDRNAWINSMACGRLPFGIT